MSQQQQQPSPGFGERYAAMASWLGLLCQTLEASVAVFLRRGVGARYLGMQAAAVIPVVLIYSLLWRGHDVGPLVVFLALYLCACAFVRISGWRARRRGEVVHSHYSGTPTILRWPVFKGRLTERVAKSTVEPLLVLLVGVLLRSVSEPLGSYLMLAAGGLFVSVQMTLAYERKRLADAQDAYIEQCAMSERFHNSNWD